jgi:diguanylate cyclase (GGDEF)-like protein
MSDAVERATLLIVDDTPVNIRILGQALREDYQVRVATSGADALRIAAYEDPPDLILLDVLMPEMDGYEVCRRLKAEAHTRRIPVIFVTAKDAVDDETFGLELGAVDYITKPFSMAIVKARIRTHLELKLAHDRLESLSFLDGLTGIPNRRRFDHLLELEWRRAVRTGDFFSVLMIDIDHFKIYNDSYGHLAGDDCIRRIAVELSTGVQRLAGTVARYGGEEFGVLLPRSDSHAAVAGAEELRARVEALRLPHGGQVQGRVVTISLGAATTNARDGALSRDLVAQADRSLYEAKRAGRNRVHAWNEPAEVSSPG